MFNPISPPPTEHHNFASGLSTEFGDNAKTVAEKINAGFKHVYGVLAGMGASLADEVEYVAKSEFDALVHELDEAKADLANLKMMVQGLGFAGARSGTTDGLATHGTGVAVGNISTALADPSATHGMTGVSWGGLTGAGAAPASEPVVTVKEVTEQ